jgi:integrase
LSLPVVRTGGPIATRRTKRADGRYIVNVTLENPDGTKRRVYFYGRTQADAKRQADAARERVAQGGPVRDATRSVSDWLTEWRETFLQASDRAASTKSLYAGLTLRHVEPVIGRTPLGQVRPSDVTRVLLAMERGGSAASTPRNAYAALRSAFDDAVADGLLALNPVLRVRRPKALSAEARSLTVDEVTAFLASAEGLRYAGVLRLILGTGLRRGEALALRWSDVNLDRGEATVKGSLIRRDGQLVVTDTKSMRSRRTVSLSPAMVQFLTVHHAHQNCERVRAATSGPRQASSSSPSSASRLTRATCCAPPASPRGKPGYCRSVYTPCGTRTRRSRCCTGCRSTS